MYNNETLANSTRIIFLRHGQSTYNEQKLYQGCCDESLLNQKGRIQADRSGKFLSNIPIDAIYVSPLQRTQETAQQILKIINTTTNYTPKLKLDQNLKEIDLPGWQGLSFKYVRENLAEDYRVWEEKPHEFIMETVTLSGSILAKTPTKPVLELYKKAEQFWQNILPNHPNETILIVSHGGTIRALIGTALGINSSQFHTFQQSNCGISILNFQNSKLAKKTESTKLEAVNITQHLDEILPKLKNGKHGLRLLLLPVNPEKNHLEEISNFLKDVEFNFCISSDTNEVQKITKVLIKSDTNPVVNLQLSHQDFSSLWHQTISNQNPNIATLSTGIVIADTKTIQSVLNQILQLETNSQQLDIQPNKISILFYPKSHNQPIIQAINICK
ncbi:MAG: histidine phosphatase family protein [Methylacidiphilales bacterium]|nr:histidine phosphatase family protein [Candidatus Methylacidiphilales bacterium]NJR16673.1 histidine phosphatase family protein [Calothrix sp. CSU_2_0]